jgi:hypothetical protein
MGNNTSRDTQWSEAPKRLAGPLCGAVRPEPRFPSLPPILCNRELAHSGEHCRTSYAGVAVIESRWAR